MNVLKHFVHVKCGCGNQWLWWLSASIMTLCHHFDSTSDPEPKNISQVRWVLLLEATTACHGQHINVLKPVAYVQYGYGKQFEVAVSFTHDVMTSFWLHKWPRIPNSEQSSVGITVYGRYLIPMDSIWMSSNTLCMSNMDVGSSLRWLSASIMT